MMKWGLMALLLLMVTGLSAQQVTEDQRNARRDLSEAKAKYIAQQLAFDSETTQRFVELYGKQQRELWALSQRNPRAKAERSDAEVEREIKARFERSEQMLTIRKKYYGEYRRFLSPQQIERVYELDRQAMARLGKKWGRRAEGMKDFGKGVGKRRENTQAGDSLRPARRSNR